MAHGFGAADRTSRRCSAARLRADVAEVSSGFGKFYQDHKDHIKQLKSAQSQALREDVAAATHRLYNLGAANSKAVHEYAAADFETVKGLKSAESTALRDQLGAAEDLTVAQATALRAYVADAVKEAMDDHAQRHRLWGIKA